MKFGEFIINIIKDGSDEAYQSAKSIHLRDILIPMRTFYKNALRTEFSSQCMLDDESTDKLVDKFAPTQIYKENGEPIKIDVLYTSEYVSVHTPLGDTSKSFVDMSTHEKAMFTDELVDRITPYVNNAFTEDEMRAVDEDDGVSVILNESCCNVKMMPTDHIASITCAALLSDLPTILSMYTCHAISAQEAVQKIMSTPEDYTAVYQVDYLNHRKSVYGIVNHDYGLDLMAAWFISNHIVKSIHNRLKVIFIP